MNVERTKVSSTYCGYAGFTGGLRVYSDKFFLLDRSCSIGRRWCCKDVRFVWVGWGDVVYFGNTRSGMVINLELDTVSVIILTLDKDVYRGLWVYRTGDIMYMSIGCDLLGCVVNPLGILIDGEEELFWSMRNRIEVSFLGFIDRKPVSIFLITGCKVYR